MIFPLFFRVAKPCFNHSRWLFRISEPSTVSIVELHQLGPSWRFKFPKFHGFHPIFTTFRDHGNTRNIRHRWLMSDLIILAAWCWCWWWCWWWWWWWWWSWWWNFNDDVAVFQLHPVLRISQIFRRCCCHISGCFPPWWDDLHLSFGRVTKLDGWQVVATSDVTCVASTAAVVGLVEDLTQVQNTGENA